MNEFKVGDIVKLKSGSPKMTIEATKVLGFPDHVMCYWFDEDRKYRSRFHKDTLIFVVDTSNEDSNS